jgi:hypothetical protein
MGVGMGMGVNYSLALQHKELFVLLQTCSPEL